MASVTFSISPVNRLRNAAARARTRAEHTEPTEPDDLRRQPEKRDGWSISACDPNDLLGVFKALRLKAGFALHAYEFRSGGNGNEDVFRGPPKPRGHPADAGDRGRQESLVLPLRVGPRPRGGGIRGPVARPRAPHMGAELLRGGNDQTSRAPHPEPRRPRCDHSPSFEGLRRTDASFWKGVFKTVSFDGVVGGVRENPEPPGAFRRLWIPVSDERTAFSTSFRPCACNMLDELADGRRELRHEPALFLRRETAQRSFEAGHS